MAVIDRNKKQFLQDRDENVFIGIDLPFRKSDGVEGWFESTTDTISAVKNNIANLLRTHKGERFFQPNLGIGLKTLLFEHITNENLIGVQDAILDKLEFWLPFVEVRDIQIETIESTSIVGTNEIRIKIL